ncbi:MAG: hypothetical protein JST27_06200 [Bacteroidetes bacterium]|nr:hypothetical protein [Bacteroidota bacterium]
MSENTPSQKAKQAQPQLPLEALKSIQFGRYSDNNKPYEKIQLWYQAQEHFKKGAFEECTALFFEYINDEEEGNLTIRKEAAGFSFNLAQGSKSIYGKSDGKRMVAEAPIVVMEQASVSVMRRLLEENYALSYSRYALDNKQRLCLVFESDLDSCSPQKLYHALREVAQFADDSDDLLLQEFPALKPVNCEHVQPLPAEELEVKFAYFHKWIKKTLELTKDLNPDLFSSTIAYVLHALLFRIDYLIAPKGSLAIRLEEIISDFQEEEEQTPIVERNARMKESIQSLLEISEQEFSKSLYRVKSTFATAPVPTSEQIINNISTAYKDAAIHESNRLPIQALAILEYGVLFNQFSFSMPAVQSELAKVFMAVLHDDYFRALGTGQSFYHPETQKPDEALIRASIDECIRRWLGKYESLRWDHARINYGSLWDFARSFSEYAACLNLEPKR